MSVCYWLWCTVTFLSSFQMFCIFMVPLGTLVTFSVIIWMTFIRYTFFTLPIFFVQALYSSAKANLEGTLILLLGLLCPSFEVLSNSYFLRSYVVSWSAGLHRVFLLGVCVLWFIILVTPSPVLAHPVLFSRFFSSFLFCLSTFLISFASLFFLIFSNFSS